MNAGRTAREDAPPCPRSPELEAGNRHLVRSRLLGRLSACVFLLAALAVIDGLQTIMRQDFNAVALSPGETVLMSGMMPQNATSHTDLRVEMDGLSGLTFRPMTSFKGFWMGGDMWRAELRADRAALPGRGTLTVVDMVPMRKVGQATLRDEDHPRSPEDEAPASILGQNPTLIYAVSVWASAADRAAAELSFFRRFAGLAPFIAAAAATGCALLLGVGNFLCFSRAEARLAQGGVYVIHGVKKQAEGLDASFAHADQGAFAPGDAVLLYDRNWRERGRGVIVNRDRFKGFARFSTDNPPRYGWLVDLQGKR